MNQRGKFSWRDLSLPQKSPEKNGGDFGVFCRQAMLREKVGKRVEAQLAAGCCISQPVVRSRTQ